MNCRQLVAMRALVCAALALCVPGLSFAQEWIDYSSRQDFFHVNFPVQPKVQDITFKSDYDATFPGRVYSADEGTSRYSVTVIDFTDAERIHRERVKNCPPDAQSACSGAGAEDSAGVGNWRYDVRGSVDYVSSQILHRDAKMTYFGWTVIDRVEGRQIQLTNSDRSRSFFAIHLHENRLYILEATVPAGYPEPGLFQQSLRFLDKAGNAIRYQTMYSNFFPVPPRVGGGRGGGGGGNPPAK